MLYISIVWFVKSNFRSNRLVQSGPGFLFQQALIILKYKEYKCAPILDLNTVGAGADEKNLQSLVRTACD